MSLVKASFQACLWLTTRYLTSTVVLSNRNLSLKLYWISVQIRQNYCYTRGIYVIHTAHVPPLYSHHASSLSSSHVVCPLSQWPQLAKENGSDRHSEEGQRDPRTLSRPQLAAPTCRSRSRTSHPLSAVNPFGFPQIMWGYSQVNNVKTRLSSACEEFPLLAMRRETKHHFRLIIQHASGQSEARRWCLHCHWP